MPFTYQMKRKSGYDFVFLFVSQIKAHHQLNKAAFQGVCTRKTSFPIVVVLFFYQRCSKYLRGPSTFKLQNFLF